VKNFKSVTSNVGFEVSTIISRKIIVKKQIAHFGEGVTNASIHYVPKNSQL